MSQIKLEHNQLSPAYLPRNVDACGTDRSKFDNLFESEGQLTDSLQSKSILENETINKTLNFDTIVSLNPQKDQNVHLMQIWWTNAKNFVFWLK